MAKPLVKIIKPERILALDQIKDLTLYSQRTGGLFGSQGCQHCCEEEDDDDHEDAPKQAHEHQPIDGHFWLDIDNAKRCARAIADFIIQKYPEYKDDVSTNLTKLESDWIR